MKVLVSGAMGGTGRLIVRDAAASGHSVVALVRSTARADLPGVDMIEGDARDTGFHVVKDGPVDHLFEPQQRRSAGWSIRWPHWSSPAPSSDKVGQMSKISWRQVSALALAAFFVVGSLSNIFAPPSIYEEYLRWGYPRWFHFVTGSLELTTAVLLARAQTRLWGSALGCTVMLAALATVTLHGEYGHGVAPLVVATLSILVGWIAWRKRLCNASSR